jgi:acyl dehydratase
MANIQIGDRFSREYTFTVERVREFSLAAGDDNPLHLDPEVAAASQYGGLIASGTHTTALMLGLTASHFSKLVSVVGKRFTVELKRAVPVDAVVSIEWEIVQLTPRPGRSGRVAHLEGALVDKATGEICVKAVGEVVIEI